MIEEYDDSAAREARIARNEFAEGIEARIAIKPATDCPYCLAAVIGGAPGDRNHTDYKRIGPDTYSKKTHWVRITDDTQAVWTLDAACGETFRVFVDSGD